MKLKLFFIAFILMYSSVWVYADQPSTNNAPNMASLPASAAAQVTISPDQQQINLANHLFHQADYQHLQNDMNDVQSYSLKANDIK